MSTTAHRWVSLAAVAAFGSLVALGACAPAPEDLDTDELKGAEETGSGNDAISGSVEVGTKLTATTNVNLRSGPSTSKSILHVVPEGATVVVQDATPQNGFYKVKHDGTVGWSYGQYYKLTNPDNGGGDGLSDVRQAALSRAKSSVGFSYWWGHGRFRPEGPTSANKGSCSGSCPDCSHSGSYGGDCSGLAAKVWQVPSTNNDLTDDEHPYSTVNFNKDSDKWSTVSRGNVKPMDAMVYNTNGAGHIFMYSSGDGWGQMYAYECKGCSAGCVYNLRTASDTYHAIRKTGW